MNVCILTHTFPRNDKDSSAAFMKSFSDGLVEAGNNVTVVTPFDKMFKREGDKFKIRTYKYIWPDNFHALGYSRTMNADVKLKPHAYFLIPFMIIFGSIALIKTVKNERIDVINSHWALPNGLIAFIASILTGAPYVVTIPGTDTLVAKKNSVFKFVAKVVIWRSSAVVSNSRWLLKKFIPNQTKKNTAVISYPVDVSAYKPVISGLTTYKRRHDLMNKKIILSVGRLVYKKGFEYLIKAMPEVLREHPNTILLVGGDGDLKQYLQNLTKKLKLDQNITFTGNIDRNELIYYYNLADVMVAPSIVDKSGNADGGPVVSFESMACGKPQVVTNILGVASFIENDKNGYVVPQKSTKALSEAIIRLLSSGRLRSKMGKNNRKLVTREFGTKSIGNRYTQLFNEVI